MRERRSTTPIPIPDPRPRIFRLPVLVASREGYRNLCRLVTRMKLRRRRGRRARARRARRPGRRARGARRPRASSTGRAMASAAWSIVWSGHSARHTSASSCNAICCAMRKPIITRCAISRRPFTCRSSPPTASALPMSADRPLYDVLTCIRHKTTLEHAGRRLSWNAERYLKPADAMARLFSDLPEAIAGTRELADRLEYTMADLGYRFPEYPVPPGETMASFLRKIAQAGARERYRPYHDRARAQIARELESHREARSRRLLPHRLGHRQFLPAGGHPRAGARLGRQQRRLLQPRDHGRGSGRDGSAVRAIPVGGARRVARHRSRPAERRSPRARDPARLREIRQARRGDDRQRDYLSRPERGARSGQGPVARQHADRSAGEGA